MNRIRRGFWWVSLLVSLLGLGISAYLTVQHFTVLRVGFTGKSFCNMSSYLNCDIVLTSRYSVLGTLPLAGLGLVFYLYLTGALLYARWEDDPEPRFLSLPFVMVGLSCFFSLFLAYVSLVKLQSFCIFCSALYLVSFLMFFLLKATLGIRLGDTMKIVRQIPWMKSLLYFTTVFVIGGTLLHTTHQQFAREPSPELQQRYVDAFMKQPQVTIDVTGRPFWGDPNAKVVVAEFSDFECPYCKLAAFNLKPLLADYKDRVKLVFLNFPLDKSCNKYIEREMHLQACNTAAAAYCAGVQDQYWEYHDLAFDRQPKFNDASLQNMAKKLKLNLDQFAKCLQDPATKDYLVSDVEQGNALKIQGTPSVFINGRLFPDWRSKELFHAILDKELARNK